MTRTEPIVEFERSYRCVVILSPASRQVWTIEEDTSRREKEAGGKTKDAGKTEEFNCFVRSVSCVSLEHY